MNKVLTVSNEFAPKNVLERESVGENDKTENWFEVNLTVAGMFAGIIFVILGIIVAYQFRSSPLDLAVGVLMIFFGVCVMIWVAKSSRPSHECQGAEL